MDRERRGGGRRQVVNSGRVIPTGDEDDVFYHIHWCSCIVPVIHVPDLYSIDTRASTFSPMMYDAMLCICGNHSSLYQSVRKKGYNDAVKYKETKRINFVFMYQEYEISCIFRKGRRRLGLWSGCLVGNSVRIHAPKRMMLIGVYYMHYTFRDRCFSFTKSMFPYDMYMHFFSWYIYPMSISGASCYCRRPPSRHSIVT